MKFKFNLGNRQKITVIRLVTGTSIIAVASAIIMFAFNMGKTKVAYAVTCSGSYTLNWNNPSTYTVTCGTINSAQWTVKKDTCYFFSPVVPVGGPVNGTYVTVDISVRINQSGNLTNNDFAWVMLYANGALSNTYTCRGDTLSGVFFVSVSFQVPSGGNFQIKIKLKNDRNVEFWQVKNGDITACIHGASPLPLSLVSFTGKITGNKTLLEWTTASENNNDYFTLEKSINGTDFRNLSKIKGAGNSTNILSYKYIDNELPVNETYYRLSQTDYNGTNKAFPVIGVKNNTSVNAPKVFMSPNPFTDNFKILFESSYNKTVTATIYDTQGKLLERKYFNLSGGGNLINYNWNTKLNAGMYQLILLSDNGEKIYSARIIKQ